MSVVLSSITGQTKEGTVEIGDVKVPFVYRPYAVTVEMTMSLMESSDETLNVLAEVIDSWDLVLSEDEPFEPTAENLKVLPMELANLFAKAIISGEGEIPEAGGSFAAG